MPESRDFHLEVREQDFILVLFISFNLLIVLYALFSLILLVTQLCHYWLNTRQKSKVSLYNSISFTLPMKDYFLQCKTHSNLLTKFQKSHHLPGPYFGSQILKLIVVTHVLTSYRYSFLNCYLLANPFNSSFLYYSMF